MKSPSLELLGRQLREDLSRHEAADRGTEARSRRQLLTRLGARRNAAPRWYWAVSAAALAAAALVFVLAKPRAAEADPLRFWVEERAGRVDEWVTARDAEQSLRFSDGSSVVAAPHTTTRVMRVTADGAQLTLERGHVDAHVVHRDGSRWQVAAGPFVVRVTGTRFRVSWDPQTEKLAVKVTEGRVEVSGDDQPMRALTAGSSLELSASPHVAVAPSTSPAVSEVAPVGAAPAGTEPEAPRRLTPPKPDFRELSTTGRYREALAAVEQLGFAGQCASLSARDLLTLASTARLAGSAERAREAYLAARQRFPGSSEASISAFSLGRLASDAGRASDAVTWFKRYLAEAPSGPLAREAAGRLVELWHQQGNKVAARSAAESYLKSYPSGPHAGLSRSVLAAQ
ncbi:MAG: tetratricopeptide repeat protein [Myxococcales bacterium]|nr:MAG: tetratricopeptide repeat protein [Myxococcales bacterium]